MRVRPTRVRPLVAGAALTALGVTAMRTPTVALAAPLSTTGSSQVSSRGVSPCMTRYLTEWIGLPGSGAAGSAYYELEFTNISSRRCSFAGFPGVSALSANDHEVGRSAAHQPGTQHRVFLAPGATAHAVLQVTVASNFPSCHLTTAQGLRVYPPGQSLPQQVPLTLQACTNKGPIFLHVTPVESGVGIPGYST